MSEMTAEKQPEDANSGLVLPQPLRELLEAYGIEGEYERISDALPYHLTELAPVDVLNIMARLGYVGAPLETRLRDIDPRLLPCLFVGRRKRRMRAITEPTFERNFGTAYVFTKQASVTPKEQKEALAAIGRGWFATTLARFRSIFVRAIAISLALGVVALAMPLFLMVVYDRVADITTSWATYALGAGAIIALALEEALRQMRSARLAWFAARIDNIVSNRVLSRLLQLPAHAVESASVASQVSRLRSFEAVREFFTGPVFLTLLDLPFTLLAFLMLAILGGPLALIPLGLVALYAALLYGFRTRIRLAMFHSARTRSSIHAQHIELFDKLRALRLNGMSEIWRQQYREISARGSLALFRSQYLGQVLETAVYTLTALGGIAVIYMGVMRVWDGVMSGGALFASLILFWRVIGPWQTLASNVPRLEQLRRSTQQIDRLMALDTERESALALAKPAQLKGQLAFANVGLRYSKDSAPVFVGLSFAAQAGELVAVAGGNGSGKSTVLKLALGLYRPQAGAIYLDGRDIRQFDPVELRRHLAYVPQIPELFDGTIAENMRFGNPAASDAELWQALELADARLQVEQMPQGLNTSIQQGGGGLRSSLAYQIVLARAYAKNAPLLLMDEMPNTLLNSRAGATFVELLREWHGVRTVVMVSHRDSHIGMADTAIGLLEGGRLAVGKPDTVIRQLRNETFKEQRSVA